MNPTERKEVNEALADLPDPLKRALHVFDWSQEVFSIGRELGLQIDDLNTLREETLMMIVGVHDADKYERSLQEKLSLSSNEVQHVIGEANTRIFGHIQKVAFGQQNETIGDEVPEEQVLHNELKEEGIHLIDEDYQTQAHDDTQTTNKTSEARAHQSTVSSDTSNGSTQARSTFHDDLRKYREEPSSDDYKTLNGISLDYVQEQDHKTNRSAVVFEKTPSNPEKSQQHLDKQRFEEPYHASDDTTVISPTKTELESTRDNYLETLKGSSTKGGL